MIKDGSLSKSDRFELIDGHPVKMRPVGSKRASCIERLTFSFTRKFGRKAILSVQKPLCLDEYSELQPDMCVLKPRADRYARTPPTPADVRLIVEFADSSAAFIREAKLPLYAQASVPEVWLVDLSDLIVEVYARPSGGKYKKPKVFKRREDVISATIPDLTYVVDAVLMFI